MQHRLIKLPTLFLCDHGSVAVAGRLLLACASGAKRFAKSQQLCTATIAQLEGVALASANMASSNGVTKRAAEVSDRVGVIVLAAGYGTRLARDMATDKAFVHMKSTPKPLLPVGGKVLLDHWVSALEGIATLAQIVVVTNGAHHGLYSGWAENVNADRVKFANAPRNRGSGYSEGESRAKTEADTHFVRLVSDGSTSNDNRLGAVADMRIGLDALAEIRSPPDIAIIIAGDTLLPTVDMCGQLSRFCESGLQLGVFGYPLQDVSDCVRRGMLEVGKGGRVVGLVEKPSVENCPSSRLATAPVYMLRKGIWSSPADFLKASEQEGAELGKRDAPGFWLSWAIPRNECALLMVDSRVDIGGLAHYKEALVQFATSDAPTRQDNEPAVGRALPRVGLLGNPSDGYGGRCVAFAIQSEGYAEVVATPSEYFAVVPNPRHEMPQQYESLTTCAKYIADHGIHYGASQLVLAGVSMFVDAHMQQRWKASDRFDLEDLPPAVPLMANCHLTYSTTIPTRLGLSGSSALVLATIRALARFHNTSLERMDEDIATWPQRVLRAETELLGITAGLMDRVAQVYEGCTYMDFSVEGKTRVERLDERLLPKLWLAYSSSGRVGDCSGGVHNDLRERYESGDKAVIASIDHLAHLAGEGKLAIQAGTLEGHDKLASLMHTNWEIRKQLMGPAGISESNLLLVATAQRAGFVAKQTGSGGAIVCIPSPARDLSEKEVAAASQIFDEAGFVLRPVLISQPARWQP